MNGALKGVVFLILSNIAFCAMACLVRYTSELSASITTLFRFGIGMGVIGILALLGKAQFSFVDKKSLFLRGILGGIAICIGFISITKLGLVKSSIIVNTYPIFASIFGTFILREKIDLRKAGAITMSFLGAVLVISDCGSTGGSLLCFGRYECIAIIGAMLAGMASVYVKKLQSTDSTVSIYFAQCLVGFWLVIIPAGHITEAVSYRGSLLLILIGLLAAIGQLVLTEGYRYITISTGALIIMTSPIMNIIAGVLFFGEALTMHMILGSVIVLSSGLLLTIKKSTVLKNEQVRSAAV